MLPSLIVTSVKVEKIEPVHYVYTHYLGSGIYKTTGQHASLVSMPFSYKIGQKDNTSYSLRLPISLVFFDFGLADLPNLDFPDEVGTVTFTQGITFNYQYNNDLFIESYLDNGYGRNLTTNKGINIHSSGVSALYNFDIKNYDAIWANRIYYARYDGNGYDAKDSYAALQTAIDVGLLLQYQVFGY
jgi:glutamine cyclotransferase